MSVMKSLRRLLPTRKAWRLFTKTLQTKLHKLNRSKAIKKHKKKNHPHHHHLVKNPNSSKPTIWKSLSFQSRSKQKTKTGLHVNTHRYKPHHHRIQKKSAPVYVDHLFIEPVLALNQPSDTTASGSAKGKARNAPATAGTSKGDEKSQTADDMWESLILASPQMYGINERAEEFISRFRAEMQGQERLDSTQL